MPEKVTINKDKLNTLFGTLDNILQSKQNIIITTHIHSGLLNALNEAKGSVGVVEAVRSDLTPMFESLEKRVAFIENSRPASNPAAEDAMVERMKAETRHLDAETANLQAQTNAFNIRNEAKAPKPRKDADDE